MHGGWVMLLLAESSRILMQRVRVMHILVECHGILMQGGRVMLLSVKYCLIPIEGSGGADF